LQSIPHQVYTVLLGRPIGFPNDISHYLIKSIRHHFLDDFVIDSNETYWPKIIKANWVFQNKGYERVSRWVTPGKSWPGRQKQIREPVGQSGQYYIEVGITVIITLSSFVF